MEKIIEEAGIKKAFELDHKELRLFIAGKNSTSNEEGRFEKCGGISEGGKPWSLMLRLYTSRKSIR